MKKLFVLGCLLVVAFVAQSQKVNLVLNLKAGQTYYQNMSSISSVKQEVAGQKMDIRMDIKGKISYTVEKSQDGVYDLQVQYESLTMLMDVPMKGKMTFSSENKDSADPASKILSALAGSSFQVKMTNKGAVKEVAGFDSLLTKIFEATPEIPQSQVAQIKKQIEGAYGVESFKKNFALFAGAFPANPVEVGEIWTVESKIENLMTMQMFSKFTLKSVAADSYEIESEATLGTQNSSIEANGIQMSYDLKGTMKSTFNLDKSSGWVKRAEVLQDIQGEINMGKAPQMPDGMKIPMTVNTFLIFTD